MNYIFLLLVYVFYICLNLPMPVGVFVHPDILLNNLQRLPFLKICHLILVRFFLFFFSFVYVFHSCAMISPATSWPLRGFYHRICLSIFCLETLGNSARLHDISPTSALLLPVNVIILYWCMFWASLHHLCFLRHAAYMWYITFMAIRFTIATKNHKHFLTSIMYCTIVF